MERAGREENPGAGVHGLRIDEGRLHQLYVEELEAAAPRPEERKVSGYQMRALVRAGERLGPGIGPAADARTWVWSDLHLAHEPSRVVFRRPFATAGAADGAMMRAWKELVADGDDIICLGDVTVDGRRGSSTTSGGRRGRAASGWCSGTTTSTRGTGTSRPTAGS